MNNDKTIRASLKSEVVKVICTEYCAGEGTQEKPMRTVLTWHTVDGSFIGRRDPGYSEHEECKKKEAENEELFARVLGGELLKQRDQIEKIVQKYIDDEGSFGDPEPKEILRKMLKEIQNAFAPK